jgi:uncharacterized cupin superfamily protein
MTRVIDLHTTPEETTIRALVDEPGRVLGGDPRQAIGMHHVDGPLRVGIWTSTPGRWRAFGERDEYCHILSGRCALIHADGTRAEFGPGASFLIPNGFEGEWEVMETCTKHFVILSRTDS